MKSDEPEVKYNSEENFILVKEIPKTTLELLQFELFEVLKLSELHNCNNVLVDGMDVESYPQIFESFSFGTTLAQKERLRLMNFVILVSELGFETAKFIETVAHNRGFNLKLFRTIEEAKEALLSK
jgi:hypothetical protein